MAHDNRRVISVRGMRQPSSLAIRTIDTELFLFGGSLGVPAVVFKSAKCIK